MVDDLQLTTGIDIPVEELGVTIIQPKLREIAILGQQNYFIALQIFLIDKKQLHLQNKPVTNWDIFKKAIHQKMDNVKDVFALVSNFLQLFFKEKVVIGPRSIMIFCGEEIKNIEGETFDMLRRIIGEVGGKFLIAGAAEDEFNPANKKAAEIAEKMKKGREKLAKAKELENPDKKEGSNFLSKYIKIVAVKTANSLEQVNNMTLYQLNALMKGEMAYENYDIDVRSRLAGAKSDKELVSWTEEL